MRKGDLVRLNSDDETISRHLQTTRGYFRASRPITREEAAEWREERRKAIAEARKAGEDTFSIAFDDAGESRLPPKSVGVELALDGVYIVERARCRVELGWGNPQGGMTKILDTTTGEHAFVRREMLEVVE
jgi:hypothetical protein